MKSPFIVSTHWLTEHLHDENLSLIDCRMPKPGTTPTRSLHEEYLSTHIPGAVYFDLDAFSDTTSPLPHMLPDDISFAQAIGRLGVNMQGKIVIYDDGDLFSAPRVWWMLRNFGAQDVCILDGGLNSWRQQLLPIENGVVSRPQRQFAAHFDRRQVQTAYSVNEARQHGSAQILDARSAARFIGAAPEPRPGLRSGHIPGSINVPYSEILQEGHLKSLPALKEMFLKHGVDLERPIITSCGSGVTAAALTFALASLGITTTLYDGSWAEWGAASADWPINKGEFAAR